MQRTPFDPMGNLGTMLLVMGLAIAALGALILLGGRIGLGRLPGDLRFGGEGWGCFVPITTSLVLSLLLTLILNLIWRWWR